MEEQFKTLIVLSHYLEVHFSVYLDLFWQNYPCISTVNNYFIFLQTARFRQFWDEAAKNRHMVEVVPGNEKSEYNNILFIENSFLNIFSENRVFCKKIFLSVLAVLKKNYTQRMLKIKYLRLKLFLGNISEFFENLQEMIFWNCSKRNIFSVFLITLQTNP